MTMLKVFERLYDEEGRPILKRVPTGAGNTALTSDAKMWYMDLSSEEEQQLRVTGKFAFEAIPAFDLPDVSVKAKREGANRKKEIFSTLGSIEPTV